MADDVRRTPSFHRKGWQGRLPLPVCPSSLVVKHKLILCSDIPLFADESKTILNSKPSTSSLTPHRRNDGSHRNDEQSFYTNPIVPTEHSGNTHLLLAEKFVT
jgi:hypothetical protein